MADGGMDASAPAALITMSLTTIHYARDFQTGVHVPPGAHFNFSRGALD